MTLKEAKTEAEALKIKEAYKRQTLKRAADPKRIEYRKQYRQKNKDRIRAYQAEYKAKKADTLRQEREAYLMRFAVGNETIDEVRARRQAEGARLAGELARARWAAHYEANKERIDAERAVRRLRYNERRRNDTAEKERRRNSPARKEYEKLRALRRSRSPERKTYLTQYNEKYRDKKRKYLLQYNKRRRKEDPEYRLIYLLRKRTLGALRRLKIGKTFQSPVDFLGCTIAELKAHLEQQFEPWMTWENHGTYGWHVDHVVPLSSFDLSDPEQYAKASHYTNLRPLHWRENLSKGGKIIYGCKAS